MFCLSKIHFYPRALLINHAETQLLVYYVHIVTTETVKCSDSAILLLLLLLNCDMFILLILLH